MKKTQNNVWIGTDQFSHQEELAQIENSEFVELPVAGSSDADLRMESNRRDFLKYLGFGIGAVSLASCEIPVRKAIPYVVKPDSIVPGVATYFASTYISGSDYCPILVKTREGRPIKVEGNSLSSITSGGTCARTQASVLSLYDTSRYDAPQLGMGDAAEGSTWKDVDAKLHAVLNEKSSVRIVANTILSPSTKQVVKDFQAAHPNTQLVMFDPVSSSALLQAAEATYGEAIIPEFHFDKADVIVGIDCDFLGTWMSSVEYTNQYVKGRKVTGKNTKMSRHIQVESYMSLTGSNADNRVPLKPSEMGAFVLALYNNVVGASAGSAKLSSKLAAKAASVAKELKAARGKSLVVCGSNNKNEQILVNAINNALGNYGKTITRDNPLMVRQGSDLAMTKLIKEMQGGKVDVLIVLDDANPAYNAPNAAGFRAALDKVKTKVSCSPLPNETAVLCDVVAPTHHFLESWGDAEPKQGIYSLIQPAITPIFQAVGREGTRQSAESLLVWAKSDKLDRTTDQPYLEYVKQHWENTVFTVQGRYLSFERFWDAILHDGIFELPNEEPATFGELNFSGLSTAAAKIKKPSTSEELEITFYETVNMGGGEHANNPWLQEMPDPITRCVWGNYLAIPVEWDGGNSWSAYKGLNEWEFKGKADQVNLTVNGTEQVATCVRQFGQPKGTTALALGYGRTVTGKMGRALGNEVGTNVYDLLTTDEDGN
ncbi:MAG: 4Fe-4S ferredoxin, partial [Bacteroidota bacterium]